MLVRSVVGVGALRSLWPGGSKTYTYDAAGRMTSEDHTCALRDPFENAGAFGYQEEASGLRLLGHRYYDASTGRFLTRDPIKDGRNWYAYSCSNPLTWVDADGLTPQQRLWIPPGSFEERPKNFDFDPNDYSVTLPPRRGILPAQEPPKPKPKPGGKTTIGVGAGGNRIPGNQTYNFNVTVRYETGNVVIDGSYQWNYNRGTWTGDLWKVSITVRL